MKAILVVSLLLALIGSITLLTIIALDRLSRRWCNEEDHLISLELGGHPQGALNQWFEYPINVTKVKSVVSIPDANVPIKHTTRWMGYLVFATEYRGIDPGFYGNIPPPPTLLGDNNIEIGLRDDGVVVWRKKKGKEKL